jgi:acyl-coenzyme A synthetase/AMP-(fatty) acid ligase
MKPNLKEQIVNTFTSQGDKTAFVSEVNNLTYEELFEEALKLSDLIKENKLPASTFVSLEVRKNKDFLVSLIASILNELVLIPLKYDLKEEEKLTSYSITFPEYSLKKNKDWALEKTGIKKPSKLDAILEKGGFVRPTSGTTSTSKGVYISSSSALNRVEIAIEALEVSKDSTVLCLMSYPFHFIASLLSFLSIGATILTPDSFDENSIRSICKKNKPTHIYASPYHYAILSEMDLIEELSEAKLLVSTGTKIPDITRNKFNEKYFKEITEIFGIIEIGLALKSSGNENSLTPISQIEAKRS